MTQIMSDSHKVKSFKLAHTAATTAKTPLLINSKLVIPLYTALANEENVFVYASDMVEVTKAGAQAWSPMVPIYWDDTAKNFTTTATSNTLAGRVAEAAASADTVGYIDLDPSA